MSNTDRIIVVFNDVITRNRVAHVKKIANILGEIFPEVIIFIPYCTRDSMEDLHNFAKQQKKILLLVYGQHFFKGRRAIPQILSEWVLSTIQVGRMLRKVSGELYLLMGSLNAPLALLLRLLAKKKVIVFAGGFAYHNVLAGRKSFVNYVRGVLNYLIEGLTLAISNAVLIETPSMQKYVPFGFSLGRKVIGCAHFYIEDAFFRNIPLNHRKYDIGYIGALEPHKGIIELTSVLKMLVKLKPSLKILIIGDGTLRKFVEENLKVLIESGNVELIKYVSHNILPTYLSNLKVFLYLSKSDGLPNIIIEAMACGAVVVTTPVGGISDIVRDKETGFIISTNTVKDTVRETMIHVMNALDNLELATKIAVKSKEYVTKKFSKDVVSITWKKLLNIIQKVDYKISV